MILVLGRLIGLIRIILVRFLPLGRKVLKNTIIIYYRLLTIFNLNHDYIVYITYLYIVKFKILFNGLNSKIG